MTMIDEDGSDTTIGSAFGNGLGSIYWQYICIAMVAMGAFCLLLLETL
jgi:hypothetical protein